MGQRKHILVHYHLIYLYNFYLIDSIGKKVYVVEQISKELGLKNLNLFKIRAEKFEKKVDFVVCRSVNKM